MVKRKPAGQPANVATFGENKLQRQFHAPSPNQRWVSDVTHVPSQSGWLYLAVVMDLYSRAIIGWAMDTRNATALVSEALQMALWRRGSPKQVLVHSDQGAPYRSNEYQRLLLRHKLTCSMSRKGTCLDNAAMESFFHSLKTELTHHQLYKTPKEAKQDIFEYIEIFYNKTRRHSYLGYLAPFEYERLNALDKQVS